MEGVNPYYYKEKSDILVPNLFTPKKFGSLKFDFFCFYVCFLSPPCSLARQCAQLWLKTRESLGHPLGVVSHSDHLVVQREVLEEATGKVCFFT